VWRVLFLPHLHNWIRALGHMSSQMIHLNLMPTEQFRQISLQLNNINTDNLQNEKNEANATNKKNESKRTDIHRRSAFKPYVHQQQQQQQQESSSIDNKQTIADKNNMTGSQNNPKSNTTINRNDVKETEH
jgi:hypothetical protein